MSFLDYLDTLREKPKHIRARIAFIIALCITALFLILWFITLPARFSAIPDVERDIPSDDGSPSGSERVLSETQSRIEEVLNRAERAIPAPPHEAGVLSDTSTTAPTTTPPETNVQHEASRPVRIETR